ncbi:MAG: cytochrome c3 family protein, partial [Melioribacteraceae bacterium]|nr:cytochrome c3 family protein [Melioribacteraceae bacterium]
PEISIPIKIIYETNSDEGNIVTFFHNDHSSLFGYECSDCHDSESCANCHSEFKLDDIQDDPHDRCSSCHDVENKCTSCHSDNIAAPFSHAKKTGFDLSSYHNGVSCSACHTVKNKFTGLKKDCVSCHSTNTGYFDHTVTGLQLDDTHIEFYCENCHNTNNYSKKPTCSECHDEDISYPVSVPGKRIKNK